jgi:hypothetical protein
VEIATTYFVSNANSHGALDITLAMELNLVLMQLSVFSMSFSSEAA